MPDLTHAEINDLLRFSRTSMRVVVLGSLQRSHEKDAVVEAAHLYEFPPNTDDDHSYAVFSLGGTEYFFLIEQDALTSKNSDDDPEDGRIISIGLAEPKS